MTEYFNRSDEKPLRRELRNEMPRSEVLLWSRLRAKQVLGMRFRRQYSVGPYCIDFYCPEVRLAIEVDGDSHFTDEAKLKDEQRQRWVEGFGIKFLRFTNVDVSENMEGVLHVIATTITELTAARPERGEGAAETGR
jgi:very-short-patch-repair endonuclease